MFIVNEESGGGDEHHLSGPPPVSPRSGRTILLAEDDGEMREMLAFVLRRAGCEVIEAEDGLELLRAAFGATAARPLVDDRAPARGGMGPPADPSLETRAPARGGMGPLADPSLETRAPARGGMGPPAAPSLETRAPPIDLIISDVNMPGATGIEALARLRRAELTTPVILMTAFGDKRTHDEAGRLGAELVLDKPFALEDLLAAVSSVERRSGR
jgi:CheY-like chemotaxis protein